MNMKKTLLSNIIMAAVFCAIIAVNSLVFSSVLARTPENGEVKTININDLAALLPEKNEIEKKPENELILNSIPEEEAIAKAFLQINNNFNADVNELTYDTRLFTSVAPVSTAIWSVAFYIDTPEGMQPIYSATINALTGKSGSSMFWEEDLPEKTDYNSMFSASLDEAATNMIFEIFDNDGLLIAYFETPFDNQRWGPAELPEDLPDEIKEIYSRRRSTAYGDRIQQ